MRAPEKIERVDGGPGGRMYGVKGRLLPSVTNIVDVLSKPALVPWAAKKEREAVTAAAAALWEAGTLSPGLLKSADEFHAALHESLGKAKAHTRAMEAAAAIGSDVHEQIERGLRLELGLPVARQKPCELSDEAKVVAKRAYDSYKDWKGHSQFHARLIEHKVYSLEHGYAGTMDVLGEHFIERDGLWLPDRHVSVTDWKTSTSIYLSACMQIAAYRVAVIEMELHDPTVPLNGLVLRLPKSADSPEFETRFIPEQELIDTYFPAFLAAKTLWQAVRDYDERYPWRRFTKKEGS